MSDLLMELSLRLIWGSFFWMCWVKRVEASEKFIKYSLYLHSFYGIIFLFFCYTQLNINNISWPEMLTNKKLILCSSILLANFLYVITKIKASRAISLIIYVSATFYYLITNSVSYNLTFISSSLLLSGIFSAMFLGHWYLNVANLHINELKRIHKGVFIGWMLKTTVLIIGIIIQLLKHDSQNQLTLNSQYFFSISGNIWLGLGLFGIILLLSRVLWGIITTGILLYLSYKTVQIRSTQSATGILYANCIVVLIGESTAIFLSNQLNWYM